jgi:hypothetical protein
VTKVGKAGPEWVAEPGYLALEVVLVLESHRVKGVVPEAGFWVKGKRVVPGCCLVRELRPGDVSQNMAGEEHLRVGGQGVAMQDGDGWGGTGLAAA